MGIKVKFGICSSGVRCDQSKEVPLKRNNPPECARCYDYLKAVEYSERKKGKEKIQQNYAGKKKIVALKKSPIKQVSAKRLKEMAEYRKLRDKYLSENKWCEVHDCNKPSTNLHHKAGRNGDLLTEVQFFMACCETCHPNRIHHYPPRKDWARDNGYIIDVKKINGKYVLRNEK